MSTEQYEYEHDKPEYDRYDDPVYLREAPGADATSTRELVAVINSVDLTDSRVLASLERECGENKYAQSYLYTKKVDKAYGAYGGMRERMCPLCN